VFLKLMLLTMAERSPSEFDKYEERRLLFLLSFGLAERHNRLRTAGHFRFADVPEYLLKFPLKMQRASSQQQVETTHGT